MNLNESYSQYISNPNIETYESFGAALLKYIKSLVWTFFKGKLVIEDAVGESIIQVLEDLDTYEADKASFAVWVKQVVDTTCLDMIRKKMNRREQAYIGNENHDPTIRQHGKLILKELVGRLELNDRVLVQYKLDGLSDGEIAGALNIPVGTVKSRWSSVKNKLRTLGGGK
jgi:RNA polymerase sigma factor (sigma-70 family)